MKPILLMLCILLTSFAAHSQSNKWPDLNKKEDLTALNKGKIYSKDNTILKDVNLFEVKDYWIVYIKNESLHDLEKEKINRLEFPDSYWGPLKIEFINNKPKFSILSTY